LRHFRALPRYLLTLPAGKQLCIAVLGVGVSIFLYIMAAPAARNPSILAIPTVLVAWMFRRRGVYLCVAVMLVLLWVYYSYKMGSILLTQATAVSFIVGTLALLVTGLIISALRDLLEVSDAARLEGMRAYRQQQELNRIKDRFLQNVNHELRTPLTAVSGYIELLLEHGEELDAAARAAYLKNALYCCEELQLLVNNVLDSIQIDNQKELLQGEELSVAAVVSEVIERTDPRRLQEHPVRLDIPAGLLVRAHRQFMRQVLRNLLSNAFKYTPLASPLEIRAERLAGVGADGGQWIYIGVRDVGPGISADDIPHLFGQFVRLQRDLGGRVRGSGLGLYISKQLVEAMGGRIWVESAGIPGQGSCFYFTLRAAVEARQSGGDITTLQSDARAT
jgi:signal transduction histidine kinase